MNEDIRKAVFVIPAKAGIYSKKQQILDSRFCGNDGVAESFDDTLARIGNQMIISQKIKELL